MKIIKKKTAIDCFFIMPILLFVSVLIVFRSPSLPDYSVYEYMFFYDEKEGIEVTFSILKNLLNGFDSGFYIFLMIYAFLGFYLKIIFIRSKIDNIFYFLIFLIGYFLSFFTVWDLIQIRYSVAISFFIMGAFQRNIKWQFLLFFLSAIFHYSLLMVILIYSAAYFVKNFYLRLISIPIISLVGILMVRNSSYAEEYALNAYQVEPIEFISIRNFLTLILIFSFIFFYKNVNQKYKYEGYALFYTGIILYFNVFIFSIFMPSAADRLFTLVSFIFLLIQFLICKKNYIYVLIPLVFCYSFSYFYVQIYNNGLV